MSNKNRKYYKINDKGVSSSEKKAFLLKWISDKTGDVMQGGASASSDLDLFISYEAIID